MITDASLARLRASMRLTMEGFLRTADSTTSPMRTAVLRAKAASYATMLELLDEADEKGAVE